MGKEKKEKKDKKDKKDKKGKKGGSVSVYQAITGYKITIQEKELDAARAEFFMLTDKKFQLEERNHRLKDSRETNFQKAMDDLRQYKDGVRMQAPVERDQVISEMKTLWLLKQTHEEELAKLKKETKSLDKDIHINKKELKKWTDYREQGRSKMEAHIRLLNEEIVSMHENFEVIKASLRENLVHSMEDIDKNADETIKRKQEIAAEKAFKDIDKEAIVKTKDNEWMNEKIIIFRKELEDLKAEHAELERENITLMSYLFECSTDELKCLKEGFDEQFLDEENLEINSILHVDLNELESVRPTSRLAITLDKIKEIELKNESKQQLALYEDPMSSHRMSFPSESYMKLGKADYKVFAANGVKKPLIRNGSASVGDQKQQEYFGEQQWPVTHDMLRGALKKAVISE